MSDQPPAGAGEPRRFAFRFRARLETPSGQRRALLLLGAVLVIFYVSPLWIRLSTWAGTFDWGYFFFLSEVDRKSVVEFGQFPFWNPYYCGGAVHLANPQTFFLSPTFLFILAFGTPIGIRLTLTAAIILAIDGTRRFLRAQSVGAIGAGVAGAGYAVSGAMVQHLGGGHVGWVGFCVLPYALASFHRALDGDRRHVLYGGLFLAWIFGHFGGYTFPYAALTLGIYGLLAAAARGRLARGLGVIAGMVAFALGVAALRLIPILEFMRGHPRIRPDVDVVSPSEFFEIYAVHHQQRFVPGHPYVWPEYGNYLGIAALVLAVAGGVLAARRKTLRPLIYATLVFLLFQIGNVPGFPWWLVKHLPIFRFMRAPCRFTIVVGFFLCALIGLAVDRFVTPALAGTRATLPRARRVVGWLAVLLSLGFLIDAAAFNRQQWFQTVSGAAPKDPVAATFHQTHGDRHRMFAYPRTNRGTLDCFEETPLDISPRLRGDLPADEYPLDPATGTVRRVDWTPNRIVLDVDFKRPGTVVVNQNFHPSWHLRSDDASPGASARLVNEGGLLAARVQPGRQRLTFRFFPMSFLVGLGVSLLTLAYGAWLWRRWSGNKKMPVA